MASKEELSQLVIKTNQTARRTQEIINVEKSKDRSLLEIMSDNIGSQNLAYLLMVIASLLFPIGHYYVNENNFNFCQILLVRAMTMLILNFCISRYQDIDLQFKDPHNFKILLLRSIFVTIPQFIYTGVQFYLSQPIVQSIVPTGTIMVFIFDYFMNDVTITRKELYGVLMGILGIILMVNGDLILQFFIPSFQPKSQFKNYLTNDPLVKLVAALLFVAGNILWAYATVITKQLKNVNAIQVNIHNGILMLLSSAIIYPTQVKQPVSIQKFLTSIVLSGIPMAFGYILFIWAFLLTKNTGIVSMFQSVCVIYGYFISIFKYNQPINFICVVGTVLIVAGLGNVLLKQKQEETQNQIKDKQLQTVFVKQHKNNVQKGRH